MPDSRRSSPSVSIAKIKPLLRPVVQPVLDRLEHHEQLLLDMKAALDVQFKRTAQIQAQLDQLIATLTKREP